MSEIQATQLLLFPPDALYDEKPEWYLKKLAEIAFNHPKVSGRIDKITSLGKEYSKLTGVAKWAMGDACRISFARGIYTDVAIARQKQDDNETLSGPVRYEPVMEYSFDPREHRFPELFDVLAFNDFASDLADTIKLLEGRVEEARKEYREHEARIDFLLEVVKTGEQE